jgi:membrane fusion protein, multidrug efflux system
MSAPGKRLLFAGGALALLLAAGAAYRYWSASSSGRPGEEDALGPYSAYSRREGRRGDIAVTVTAATAHVADVPVSIEAVGTVTPFNSVTLRTQVDGRLVRLNAREGQDVKKDDVIAEIDPSLYKALYDQAIAKKAQDEANLANARIDQARYQKLVAGNFASKQQHETQKALVAQLEAQVRADQAQIDNTKTTLDYATIRTPIDGRAGVRLVDAGNILRTGDSTGIIIINQLQPIYVIFTIPQQALPAVQKAQARGASQALALGPDNVTVLDKGTVDVIDNQIDQATGTAKIKAVFANRDYALWPGQFSNVRLIVDTIKGAVVVPSTAIQRGPNGAFVYVLNEARDKAALRLVTTGRQDEHIAVVTNGLETGETVVTSGFARLADGAKVRVPEKEPGAGEAAEKDGAGPPGPPREGKKKRSPADGAAPQQQR